ncbi:uncharacterized protein LOC122751242 [Dromiciops gliroides]|uniref:uncharacterized protein LOC122751242 n=1 Tax=Dromiciops gliroides TaxID=33562 RepID=UPI001CC3E20F|nr:uncharacterized protein LOC122751242 [Dromiciops gliroides]
MSRESKEPHGTRGSLRVRALTWGSGEGRGEGRRGREKKNAIAWVTSGAPLRSQPEEIPRTLRNYPEVASSVLEDFVGKEGGKKNLETMGVTSLSVSEGNGSEGGSCDKLVGSSFYPSWQYWAGGEGFRAEGVRAVTQKRTPSRTQEEASFRSRAWPEAHPRKDFLVPGVGGVSHQEIGKRPPRPAPCTCSHCHCPEGPSRPLLSGLATMKLHRKPVLSYLRGTGARAPDREGILLKKGTRNSSYQRRWFILRGNLLYYLEHRGDRTPLGLILLDNCRVEPRDSSAGLYAFVIQASSEGGRCYKLAAESQDDFHGWLRALLGAGWSQLWELLQPLQQQYQRVCQEAGVEPRTPPQEDRLLGLPGSPAPSGFQELHQRLGEEIQALARSWTTRRASGPHGVRARGRCGRCRALQGTSGTDLELSWDN